MSRFLELESPIHATANAAKVLEIVVEALGQCENAGPGGKMPGCKSLLLDNSDWEALLHALYQVGDAARKSVEAYDLAYEERRQGSASL
jgi:hypothetical protein